MYDQPTFSTIRDVGMGQMVFPSGLHPGLMSLRNMMLLFCHLFVVLYVHTLTSTGRTDKVDSEAHSP